MVKGIIVYQSKYGATKKYAEWLQDITDFHCIETSKANVSEVARYETIILCVGASPYDEGAFTAIKEHNLTGDLRDIPLFMVGVHGTRVK